MKSVINWKTGIPTKFGDYLTIGKFGVSLNQWNGGWKDNDVLSWYKIDDITVTEPDEFFIGDSVCFIKGGTGWRSSFDLYKGEVIGFEKNFILVSVGDTIYRKMKQSLTKIV